MKYQAIIESKISGIPCQIGVINFTRISGNYSMNAQSDLDYFGYCEFDYHILDRKGYKADWLEKKLSQSEKENLEYKIVEYFSN